MMRLVRALYGSHIGIYPRADRNCTGQCKCREEYLDMRAYVPDFKAATVLTVPEVLPLALKV